MDEFLSFVTIDVWTMIMTWGNLLILFLLMKKFLFVPVKKVIDARQKEIEKNISDAENLKKDALNMKDEYAEKLAQAKKEADNIIKSATKTAQLREEEIIKDANNKASDIIKKADKQIENSKKEALNELKEEVSAIATSIAEKIIEKDINEKDHERLIEEFIDNMGGL
ncbi:MAG: F0F1 ATP synthase subunit B [Clostridia bacterium]|nr:F0F1 ATP synthase subunit B [Oscillospiraceae bacterium]MBR4892659.1 F0F1 ATP synthase subunit B [Clostridia bacterium]